MNNTFAQEYKKLNPEQRQAVEEIEGPVMVIAGPGTGKTQILALRIANILKKTQTNPSNILCLTFTNSGVAAMKKRLLEIIGPPSYQVQVYTFHSFCNEVIGLYPEKFLVAQSLSQLDDLDQLFLIQKILKKGTFKYIKPLKSPFYYQKTILNHISKLKQEAMDSEQFLKKILEEERRFDLKKNELTKNKQLSQQLSINKNKELAKIYHAYEQELTREGRYDYDDMVLFVLNALRTDQDLLSTYQEKFQYFLIDEFQDGNSSQNQIINLLCNYFRSPNLFVVGDDEQSIYRFQGASLENILNFVNLYPDAKIIVLKENYRSDQLILDSAKDIIKNNSQELSQRLKISKQLRSASQTLGKVYLAELSSEDVENYFIAREIKKLIDKDKIPPSEIAVLYRQNKDVDSLRTILARMNIPYKLKRRENILEDIEIVKLINFLKILDLHRQLDDYLLLEIMHYPFLKIPLLDVYKIAVYAKRNKKNIFDILTSDLAPLDLQEPEKINSLLESILNCQNYCSNHNFSHALELIIEKVGYLNYLLALKDNAIYLHRLQTLFKYVQRLNLKQKKLNLPSFLDHLEKLQENSFEINEEEVENNFAGVNLLTAHQSKGLEFQIVFIIHLIDKHWGNNRKSELIKLPSNILEAQKDNNENDEEERRLFYVAMTRAKKMVYLTYALSYEKNTNGTINSPSRFIAEISPNKINKINLSNIDTEAFQRLLINFTPEKWQISQTLEEFLKGVLQDFKLSTTSFNNFLNCPKRFFYDNILRLPRAKNFSQSYGTAVHFALEDFFKKYKKDYLLPFKTFLIKSFKAGLEREILSAEEYKHALLHGSQVLKKYYDNSFIEWKKTGPPLFCEFNFNYHNVNYSSIPITGIVDKVEVINQPSGKVRLIDYKTSAPKSLNYLLGKTREANTDYLYQAYMYKLLVENDPLFNWEVGEIVFEFISPQGFKKVKIPIDNQMFEEFKLKIKEVYQEIMKLNFPVNQEACGNGIKKCEYDNLCHLNLSL